MNEPRTKAGKALAAIPLIDGDDGPLDLTADILAIEAEALALTPQDEGLSEPRARTPHVLPKGRCPDCLTPQDEGLDAIEAAAREFVSGLTRYRNDAKAANLWTPADEVLWDGSHALRAALSSKGAGE